MMKTDIQIAQEVKIKPIQEIAQSLGLNPKQIEPFGHYKAKLPLSFIDEEKIKGKKLILVSAISPTPAGEGKTTMAIGLSDGLNRIGKKATVVIREPSLGPVFGMKGGAAGGGRAQVVPMEEINMHFTGDFSAIEKANNLLAALIDNNLQSRKKSLNIDSRTVYWRRVMDMNDRSLRQIIVGLGGTTFGVPRETGFDITAASEIMAILCLSENFEDLKNRLGNIFVGFTHDKNPIYARDLKAQGAMAALLKDAIKPNLVQTLEGNPAIIHGGPFANIAQGTNSVLATKMGLSLSDYVVTEAGFGFDLGGEKFLDIKCASAGLTPQAGVLVATIRALKYHGGVGLKDLKTANPSAVKKGLPNLEKHLENMKKYNIAPVVAINHFYTDSDEEISVILKRCKELDVEAAVIKAHQEGGAGATELAQKVAKVAENNNSNFRPLYDWNWSIEKKIETVAQQIYGATSVSYTSRALSDLKRIAQLKLENLPVCIAKTQYSMSDDPTLLGRPTDFIVTVRQIEIAAGAGFVVPITGDIMRMPGLPEHPAAETIDISADGVISGLF